MNTYPEILLYLAVISYFETNWYRAQFKLKTQQASVQLSLDLLGTIKNINLHWNSIVSTPSTFLDSGHLRSCV